MPRDNRFRHQAYPAIPVISPVFRTLRHTDAVRQDFHALHTRLGVSEVIVVHGTFMGDDPFAVCDMLKSVSDCTPVLRGSLEALSGKLRPRMESLTRDITGDVANYCDDFVEAFQQLVGGDPTVCRLQPTWSGQNHHLARADLAVRLLCRLADSDPSEHETILFWGHSHAGNGFALLSNLLANNRSAVTEFFQAADCSDDHWIRAQQILQRVSGPHPWARSVCFATFGTPVRYGWDTNGFHSLAHISHHRSGSEHPALQAHPVFPFQLPTDVLSAKYGDWVQTFGIAGTDVSAPVSIARNAELCRFLESSLAEPVHHADTRFLFPKRIRDACARWKTGTRCHADGRNVLVDYVPCGRQTSVGLPIEHAVLGHGVATTVDWLPAHLKLVIETLSGGESARPE